MPDENKFAKFREVEYKIPVTCGLCVHGPRVGQKWAECALHHYKHLRQSNPEEGRGVSVHTSGTCSTPFLDRMKAVATLGAHHEFLVRWVVTKKQP